METSLDQLIDRLQQIIWQLETLEAAFTVLPANRQNQPQSPESELSDAYAALSILS